MDGDYQFLLNVAVFIIAGLLSVFWYFHRKEMKEFRESLRQRHEREHELQNKFQKFQLDVAHRYLERERFEAFSQQIMDRLDRIYEKLDTKADRN